MDKPSNCDSLSYEEIIEILESMSYEIDSIYTPLDFHDETETKD